MSLQDGLGGKSFDSGARCGMVLLHSCPVGHSIEYNFLDAEKSARRFHEKQSLVLESGSPVGGGCGDCGRGRREYGYVELERGEIKNHREGEKYEGGL